MLKLAPAENHRDPQLAVCCLNMCTKFGINPCNTLTVIWSETCHRTCYKPYTICLCSLNHCLLSLCLCIVSIAYLVYQYLYKLALDFKISKLIAFGEFWSGQMTFLTFYLQLSSVSVRKMLSYSCIDYRIETCTKIYTFKWNLKQTKLESN